MHEKRVMPGGMSDPFDNRPEENEPVYMILSPQDFDRNLGALNAYRSQPQRMPRVWLGDDPDNPTATVLVRFANAAAADAVLDAMGIPVEVFDPPAEEEPQP